MLANIKNKFVRKTIKEVAQQVADMPDEVKEDTTMEEKPNSDEFISKRDMCFLMIGIGVGYLLFHNSFRLSSRTIKERL